MSVPPLSPISAIEEQLFAAPQPQQNNRPHASNKRRFNEDPPSWRRHLHASGSSSSSSGMSRSEMNSQYDALGVAPLNIPVADQAAGDMGGDPFGGVIPDPSPAVRYEAHGHNQWRMRDDELAPGSIRNRFFDQPTNDLEGSEISGERVGEHCYLCTIAATTATEYTARIHAIWEGGLETIAPNQLCRCISSYYDAQIREFTADKLPWAPATVFTHFTRHVISERTIHAFNTRDLTVLLDETIKRSRPVDHVGNALPLSQDTVRTLATLLGLQSRELALLDKKRSTR